MDTIILLFNTHLQLIITAIVLIISSIGFRILFESLGQRWITTYAHTATLTLLPIITFIITKVISGNIALSLGMVGALSIVRFRNPVRSPLELSVYFLAITMGISAAVGVRWLILLILLIILSLSALGLASILSKIFFKKSFFNVSFSEGNTVSTLEIKATKNILILSDNEFVTSESSDGDTVDYLLVSADISKLKIILNGLKEKNEIVNYRLNKG